MKAARAGAPPPWQPVRPLSTDIARASTPATVSGVTAAQFHALRDGSHCARGAAALFSRRGRFNIWRRARRNPTGDDNGLQSGHPRKDTINGTIYNDTLIGLSDDDKIFGGNGNDTIYGDSQDVTSNVHVGNDELHGGYGNDMIFGGLGQDTLFGDEGDDRLYGNDGHDRIFGGEGNDWIYGGTGNDTANGDAGNDVIYGDEGEDFLSGGMGHDVVFGGADNDYVWGDAGNDYVLGEDGNDYVSGGLGDDWLSGGAGNDTLIDESGINYLYGNDGNDNLWGGADSDTLDGGNGEDLLIGSFGNDYLSGGDQADHLFGESGNDWLNGGRGVDHLVGGEGADTYYFSGADVITFADPVVGGPIGGVYSSYSTSLYSASFSSKATYTTATFGQTHKGFETDTVAGFSGAEGDRIDISSLLDAVSNFTGTTAQQAMAQGYLYFVQTQAFDDGVPYFNTTVYIDRNGMGFDSPYVGDIAVATLQNVSANQLNPTHFIV